MQYKYSDLHEIYLVLLSQFNTLASEVKCLRVIERRDLSNEQNTFKSKTIFYHNKTRLKPERATRPIPKRRRPLYATATRPIPKRRRPLYATATRPIPKRRPLYATATRPIPKRRRPLYATATRPIPKRRKPLYATATTHADIESKQSAKRQRYQEDVEENRAAKRPKYEDNSAAIKASERNRYWNDPAVRLAKRAAERKRYRRGHRTTTTTQRYVMACCIALALKSYWKMCMQHVYSTHVRKGSAQNHSLHMYSMHGDPTVVYSTCSPFSFVTCLLNIGGVILNLMYKKASLSDVLRLQLCMSTETISFSHIATPCMNPNLMH